MLVSAVTRRLITSRLGASVAIGVVLCGWRRCMGRRSRGADGERAEVL
jgi:hypothetical protein